jgi:hypothetical protein
MFPDGGLTLNSPPPPPPQAARTGIKTTNAMALANSIRILHFLEKRGSARGHLTAFRRIQGVAEMLKFYVLASRYRRQRSRVEQRWATDVLSLPARFSLGALRTIPRATQGSWYDDRILHLDTRGVAALSGPNTVTNVAMNLTCQMYSTRKVRNCEAGGRPKFGLNVALQIARALRVTAIIAATSWLTCRASISAFSEEMEYRLVSNSRRMRPKTGDSGAP